MSFTKNCKHYLFEHHVLIRNLHEKGLNCNWDEKT